MEVSDVFGKPFVHAVRQNSAPQDLQVSEAVDIIAIRRCQFPPGWIQRPVDGIALTLRGTAANWKSRGKSSCEPLCDILCSVTRQDWICPKGRPFYKMGEKLEADPDAA